MRSIISCLIGISIYSAALAETPGAPMPTDEAASFQAYVTGYSYWDNTPPRTVEISHPVRHRFAGGMGTYSNPVTLAVGHRIIDGENLLDFPPGTRFYLPRLRKYAIVEDTCGDGPAPQNSPCHIGYQGVPWLDIYVDGVSSDKLAVDECIKKISGIQTVIINPPPNLSVVVGPVTEGGCFVFPDP